jgi:L-alanine-DL-glutamate epimerase-like enolase superfamily enzyme
MGNSSSFFPDGKVFNFRDIIDRQLQIVDAGLALPKAPGLGYRFDEAAMARLEADKWC